MMDTDEWLVKQFGKDGAANIKSHAATLNMPIDMFINMSQLAPLALLEALQVAAIKRRTTPTPTPPAAAESEDASNHGN